ETGSEPPGGQKRDQHRWKESGRERRGRYADGQAGLDDEVAQAPGAQSRDGVEHADEVRRDVRIGAVARPVLELEASGQFETFVLELCPRMSSAVFEHGVDGLPSDVLYGLPVSDQRSAGHLRGYAAEHQDVREAADCVGTAAEAE